MGERIAKWLFRSRVSMFELFAFGAAMVLMDGFWPMFLVALLSGLVAMRMQLLLNVD